MEDFDDNLPLLVEIFEELKKVESFSSNDKVNNEGGLPRTIHKPLISSYLSCACEDTTAPGALEKIIS